MEEERQTKWERTSLFFSYYVFELSPGAPHLLFSRMCWLHAHYSPSKHVDSLLVGLIQQRYTSIFEVFRHKKRLLIPPSSSVFSILAPDIWETPPMINLIVTSWLFRSSSCEVWNSVAPEVVECWSQSRFFRIPASRHPFCWVFLILILLRSFPLSSIPVTSCSFFLFYKLWEGVHDSFRCILSGQLTHNNKMSVMESRRRRRQVFMSHSFAFHFVYWQETETSLRVSLWTLSTPLSKLNCLLTFRRLFLHPFPLLSAFFSILTKPCRKVFWISSPPSWVFSRTSFFPPFALPEVQNSGPLTSRLLKWVWSISSWFHRWSTIPEQHRWRLSHALEDPTDSAGMTCLHVFQFAFWITRSLSKSIRELLILSHRRGGGEGMILRFCIRDQSEEEVWNSRPDPLHMSFWRTLRRRGNGNFQKTHAAHLPSFLLLASSLFLLCCSQF